MTLQANFDRPAIFFVNGLGDQLIALPTVRALAFLFPRKIQLMLGEGNYGFFFHAISFRDPEPLRVWWTDSRAAKIDVARILKRAKPCDLFISLSTWSSPSVVELAQKMEARRTVGFFDCFDDPVLLHDYSHMSYYLFAIAQKLDAALCFDDFNAPPTYSCAAEASAARFVARHTKRGERLLFVHPESSDPKRMWAPEHFSWVLTRFLDQHPDFRVFVSSVAPHGLHLGAHADRVVHLNDHLEHTLASMRYADLFLGNDSCFLHAADLFRIPSVGLFGPTKPDEWGFCITPCFRHVCGKGSMELVRREAVLESLLAVALESRSQDRGRLHGPSTL
jgi:ADP-heptose:LPS heptosyltransferase